MAVRGGGGVIFTRKGAMSRRGELRKYILKERVCYRVELIIAFLRDSFSYNLETDYMEKK